MTHRRHQRQEGAIAIIAAIMIVALMGVVALAFDVGNLYRVRTEEQSAVDSAALAGASALDLTERGVEVARSRAKDFANAHVANGGKLTIQDSDVIFGRWDADAGVFTANPSPATNPSLVNAVRVLSQSDVTTPFASASGANAGQSTVKAQATAAGGGGPTRAACAFPLVIPDCITNPAGADGTCNTCVYLPAKSANHDLLAWAAFDGSAGEAAIGRLARSACYRGDEIELSGGVCSGDCGGNALDLTSDGIKVNGGNGWGDPCLTIQNVLERNGPGTAEPFSIEVAVVASGVSPAACRGSTLSGTMASAGFTVIDILGAKCGNGKFDKVVLASPAYGGPCTLPPDATDNRFIIASIARDSTGHCRRSSEPGGAPSFGVQGRVRLVQ